MDEAFFGLLWIFGWAALLVVVWHLRAVHRQRRFELIHRERMTAMEKGIPLPELPDYADPTGGSLVADALSSLRLNPRWPLGVGALCIMLGAGTCVALFLSGDEYHNEIWPFGLIGVFLGLGLLLHYFLTRPRA
jgi:drug/metabolite transporter (DMT)-like permease